MNQDFLRFDRGFTCVCIALALMFFAAPVQAQDDDEDRVPLPDRYQGILERNPFQELSMPAASVPVAPALQALSASFGRDIAMHGIMDDGERVRVTFLDKRKNELFRLYQGAMYDGIELISVDYDAEEVVLQKGSETCMLSFKPEQAPTPAAPPPGAITPQPAALTRGAEMRRSAAPSFPAPDARRAAYRGKTIEDFLKEHPEAVSEAPSPIRVPDPKFKAMGRGMTIDKFLKENPEAAAQFPSPIRPPHPEFRASGKGETIERFIRENPGAVQQIPVPQPIQVPSPEEQGADVAAPTAL